MSRALVGGLGESKIRGRTLQPGARSSLIGHLQLVGLAGNHEVSHTGRVTGH